MELYCIRGGLALGGTGTEAGWGKRKAQARIRMGGRDGGVPGSRGKGKFLLLK